MDNEISISGTERKNSPTGKGVDPGDLPRDGCGDTEGAPIGGSYPYVGELTAACVGQ